MTDVEANLQEIKMKDKRVKGSSILSFIRIKLRDGE